MITMKNKMMKNYFISLLALLFTFIACDEEALNLNDPGSGTMEGFFTGEETLLMGVAGVYEAINPSGNDVFMPGAPSVWGESFFKQLPEMDFLTEYAAGGWWGGYDAVAKGSVTGVTGGAVAGRWNRGYAGMARINNMLEILPTIEGVNANSAAAIEGELRFLRAWLYFEMSKAYGELPLLVEVLSPAEIQEISRSPVSAVYSQIETDLLWVIENGPDAPLNGDFGRPTKLTAMSLLGKAYLQNGQNSDAAAMLQRVMDLEGSKVGLHPNFHEIKNGLAEQSPEVIFSFQATNDLEGHTEFYTAGIGGAIPGAYTHHGWHDPRIAQDFIDEFPMLEGFTFDPSNPTENRDSRLRGSFRFVGDKIAGHTLRQVDMVFGGTKISEMNNVAEAFTRMFVPDEGIDQGTWVSPIDINLIRYADVLLSYAEAKNESSGPDASVYSAVNKVRQRAGIGDAPSGMGVDEMREEIRFQRKLEFAFEGMRYWDLKRYGNDVEVINSNTVQEYSGGLNYKGGYWPIPQSAVDASPNIIQTAGY